MGRPSAEGWGEHDIRHQRQREEAFASKKRWETGYQPLEPLKPLREIQKERGEE